MLHERDELISRAYAARLDSLDTNPEAAQIIGELIFYIYQSEHRQAAQLHLATQVINQNTDFIGEIFGRNKRLE